MLLFILTFLSENEKIALFLPLKDGHSAMTRDEPGGNKKKARRPYYGGNRPLKASGFNTHGKWVAKLDALCGTIFHPGDEVSLVLSTI